MPGRVEHHANVVLTLMLRLFGELERVQSIRAWVEPRRGVTRITEW